MDAFTGAWFGSNGFRLRPTDAPHEAPASAEVAVAAGSAIWSIAYTWGHPEGAQEGLLVLGPGEADGTAVALWADSFHQGAGPRPLVGTLAADAVALSYEYAPEWRWEIIVDLTTPASLGLRMDNVVPDSAVPEGARGGAYAAMQFTLRRVARPPVATV